MSDPRAGYPSVVPYVRYRHPAGAIAWLASVLGARDAIRIALPDGTIGHAELVIGSHVISVGFAATGSGAAPTGSRSTVRAMSLVLVTNVDAATNHGGQARRPVCRSPNRHALGSAPVDSRRHRGTRMGTQQPPS